MKQTIIMIHGFRGTHHGFAKITENLQDSYHLITPDIPGFGKGDSLTHYDLESYVAWLHDFIKKQQLTHPPILLGHSFGSIITAAYGALYPETITKLILVNPISASALKGPRSILTKLTVFYYWIGRTLPEPAAQRWLTARSIVRIMSSTMAKTKDRQLRKWILHEHSLHFSSFHSASSLSEAFTTSISHSVRDVASDISVPTLLVAGDKDDITPLACQHDVNELLPDSSLQVIEGVGHLTHYETPDAVARHIHAFVKSV